MSEIQKYSIERQGGIDLDDALVPYEFGQVVKTADHEAEVAALTQERDEAKRGPCCREPWCEGDCTCEICAPDLAIRDLKAERDSLKLRVEALSKPVSDEESDTFGRYMSGNDGYDDGIRFTPGQVTTLIAARAAKAQR